MRVLVNYNKTEKGYLGSLAYILSSKNINAVSTAQALSIGELLQKAQLAKCDAIVLCNEDTLKSCVPGAKPTLDAWRGTRLNMSIPILVINKLSHIHSVPHGEWLLGKDLDKLRYIRRKAQPFRFTVLDTVDKFDECFSTAQTALLCAYDIETATRDISKKQKEILLEDGGPVEVNPTIITCASWTFLLPTGKLKTYVLPFVSFWEDHWVKDRDYIAAIKLLQKINKLPVPKIMHNGMYDCTHSIIYHAEPENFILDTMAMMHAEYSELPKDLGFCASVHLYDYIYWKDDSDQAAKEKDINKYWGYNGKDTWHTMRIALEWIRKAPAYARKNYADKFYLTYPALYCNFEGFAIDQDVRKELRTKSIEQLEKARARLHTIFADPGFNPGSWQQVEKYVYKVFGAKKPNIGKSKSGTDEKNLTSVAEQHPILARVCHEILDYREAQKAIGTYYDFLQKNGRLLWAINPFGTETERMACSASSLWCGTQVQNIPGYAKAMLVADEGYELFEIDNSQSEARCTAYCAQEENLIAALEDAERDFYRTLGTLFFDIPYEEVTDFFRNKVLKRIVHGTNYMMGAKTFIENIGVRILYETAGRIGITIVEVAKKNNPKTLTIQQFAKSLLDVYHKPFPRVREWYKEIFNEIKTTNKLVSPLGHTRHFFGDIEKNHNMLRGAVAHQPQNLSVTILNVGFHRVYTELVLPSNGEFRLKAQVHDSILGQYKIEKRDYYLPRIKHLCNNPVVIHGRTLVIPTDIKYGNNWQEKGSKNPYGTMVKYKEPA